MTFINQQRELELKAFADSVHKKLMRPKNIAKGDWRGCRKQHLLALLQLEVHELERALEGREGQAIQEECLDVAAFAFFIWDKVNQRAAKLST